MTQRWWHVQIAVLVLAATSAAHAGATGDAAVNRPLMTVAVHNYADVQALSFTTRRRTWRVFFVMRASTSSGSTHWCAARRCGFTSCRNL